MPDLNDFVRGMSLLLKPGGVVTMEFPHLLRLIDENQFDTIYQEHFSYFSFAVARKVFAADHLGLSLDAIRDLDKEGAFAGALNEETLKKIAPDYSMFRLIVNVVAEKSRWVEDL